MQKYSQSIAEGIFPLLGFFYWDWSWYFILLFYILDGLAKEILLNFQSAKIYKTQGGEQSKSIWIKASFKSLAIHLFVLVLLHLMQINLQPNFSFSTELKGFLGHKELGVAQGYILIPFVALSVWLNYKMKFIKLNEHLKLKISHLWNEHLHYRCFVLAVVGIGFPITFWMGRNELVWVLSAVALPFIYQRFAKKSI